MATEKEIACDFENRVPICIAPETRDKLRALLVHDSNFQGVGYTQFIEEAIPVMKALRARKSPVKLIDLRKYTDKDVGVFAGRDRGKAVRQACDVQNASRVHIIVPEWTFSFAAGFLDELLTGVTIVKIEGTHDQQMQIWDTLQERAIPYNVEF